MASLPVIDSHAHLQRELPVDAVIRTMDRSGVHRAILMASLRDRLPAGAAGAKRALTAMMGDRRLGALGRLAYRLLPELGRRFVGEENLEISGAPDNDAVAQAIAAYPDRLSGLYFVNPMAQPNPRQQVADLDLHVEERGFVGAKAHLWWQPYRLVRGLLPVARRCAQRRLPMLIHLGGTPAAADVEGLAERVPELPVILAHGGVPLFQTIWDRARALKNVYFDLSGPYVTRPVLQQIVRAVGAHRVLFGSDAPGGLRHGGGHSYTPLLDAVRNLPLSSSDVELILGGNMARILDQRR